MTILELREKRNKAWEAAKAFVETKRDKDGLLSAEDAASYAEMEQKIKDYGAEIERMEQMAAMDARLSKPTSVPLTAKPLNGDNPKSGRTIYFCGVLSGEATAAVTTDTAVCVNNNFSSCKTAVTCRAACDKSARRIHINNCIVI